MGRIMQALKGRGKVNEADRTQAIADYEQEQSRLSAERTQVLAAFETGMRTGAMPQSEVDKAQRRLDAIKARQTRIAGHLRLLQNVDRAVTEQREQAALMRIMAGSTRELKEADEEMRKDPDLDLDTVAGEFDEVMSATVSRAGDMTTAFSTRNAFAELDATSVDDARQTEESDFIASASSGQELANIMRKVKQERAAQTDLLNLELSDALPETPAATAKRTTASIRNQDLDWLLDK